LLLEKDGLSETLRRGQEAEHPAAASFAEVGVPEPMPGLSITPEDMPTVSVLLPVHDGAATLAAALDSLLTQTLRRIEIVVVDDGSIDGTPRILEQFARRDARIRVLSPGRVGLVRALEAGLAACRGQYVARMDADDCSLPRRLELQAAFLDANPGTGLVGCCVAFGGDRVRAAGYARHVDWVNGLLDPETIAVERFRESPFAHPAVMFRAELPARYGGYREGPFPEDYELWLRWLDQGVRMARIPATLLVWNDSPHRLSRTDARYSTQAFYALKAGYLARWLERHNPLHPEVWIIGAGRTSRLRAELLTHHGVRIAAYVDIDPRKIGKMVHGRRVFAREELPGPGRLFAVSYVGSVGADRDIEAFLQSRGYAPGCDYLLAA